MSEQQRPTDSRRQKQIQDIYIKAAEMPSAERAAFVQDACKGDPSLLEQVESILAWHDRMSGVLEHGALHAAASAGRTVGGTITSPGNPILPPGQSGVGRLASSDSIPVGGFTPGAILSDRFRIIGLIGRGGMGEVYRADDLKLGQPVALKFLPSEFASDPVRRERFFQEVRITRQLSHPNICRVYDVSEFEGRHFISMEYIDGEDLASLLNRIGYLSNEKAIDIARQLLAGMEAAHERGVLHRDLKPANIMIDGRGRVRITDFGIAIAAGEDAGATMGTPAYMAPEQFTGAPATVRSDIYGLGLVLYEIYCGKKAFSTRTLAELREQKEHVAPRTPSEIRKGMDPLVEQQIMRCIDRDPQMRPRSIRQLLASLPGGDPLAAAIAAGQTPSPEMVAASGLKEGLQPATAVMLLIAVIVGAFGVMLMNPRATLLMRNPNGKDPHVLADRAQEIIKTAGYTYSPADSAFALDYDGDFMRYMQETNATPGRWDVLQQYSPVVFWFRQSPRILEHLPIRTDQTVSNTGIRPEDPPLQYSGDVLVRLDMEGRLRAFTAIPSQTRAADETGSAPDWKLLFSAAGLDFSQWTSAEPQWNPNHFADVQAAWTGTIPGTNFPGRIEAAAYRGKPVSFEMVGPWTRPARMTAATPVRSIFVLLVVVGTTIVIVSVYLARRNLRLGRGDRRGARRIAILTMGLSAVSWLLNEHHVATGWEIVLATTHAGVTLFAGAQLWLMYLALEPAVRRRRSSILVSWTRALDGQWRDSVVGRDVLIGAALSMAIGCFQRLLIVAPAWLGYPEGALLERDIGFQFASSISSARIFDGFMFAIADGLLLAMLFVVFRVLTRSERIACFLWLLVISALVFIASAAPIIFLPIAILAAVLLLVVLLRVGVLCIAATAALNSLWIYPVTLNTSAWYSGLGYTAMILFAAATIYGFYTSLGGRRLQLFANVDGAGAEPS